MKLSPILQKTLAVKNQFEQAEWSSLVTGTLMLFDSNKSPDTHTKDTPVKQLAGKVVLEAH